LLSIIIWFESNYGLNYYSLNRVMRLDLGFDICGPKSPRTKTTQSRIWLFYFW